MWETRKSTSGRWRALNNRQMGVVEIGYQRYLNELQLDKGTHYRIMLEPKLEVNCFQNYID